MKPGRELDALIAEKVFGCKVLRATDEGLSQSEYERRRRWENERCGCAGGIHNDSDDEGCYEWLKEYSKDIAAAWEVAQKIADMDDDHDFIVHISPSKFCECEVEIKFWDNSSPTDPVLVGPIYILGESAPHAICLAALKAVGVEI